MNVLFISTTSLLPGTLKAPKLPIIASIWAPNKLVTPIAASALYTVYLPGILILIVSTILFTYILNSTYEGFTLTSVAVKSTALSNPYVAFLPCIIFNSLGA